LFDPDRLEAMKLYLAIEGKGLVKKQD